MDNELTNDQAILALSYTILSLMELLGPLARVDRSVLRSAVAELEGDAPAGMAAVASTVLDLLDRLDEAEAAAAAAGF